MTRSVRLSSLLILLLASFLNGCATTNKNTTASDANTNASPVASSSTAADSNTAAGTSASNGSASSNNTNNNKNASADNSGAANNGGKKGAESYNGPVFKNGAPPASYPAVNKKDPWESMNRSVFSFNETLDTNVLKPVAKGYKWIMPDPIETAIGNVFSNLNDIPVTFNNILQLKFNNALRSSGRFLVNTTAGLGGMLDIASDIGLEKQNEDFGQTLGYYGVSSGPYLVLPVLGPSSTRDAGGLVFDFASDPVAVGSFFVAPFIGPVVGSTRFADTRARLLENDKTLNEAALDKYEFMREAYLQRRRNLVYDGNPPPSKDDHDTE
ncbi:phospholipid-binding lipoprotein MlaA [Nitrosovibrio tenuis]|uniref:Phospholipid-binding lipoprotein MlaA n=1 Tax=Nitrosovibrio tenuis TaxID=1233 RepID=A0A1H7KSX1_9PROT|nr:phospholipid-binding lipoprotein MlaA [Nitrosovibrio tenuis]